MKTDRSLKAVIEYLRSVEAQEEAAGTVKTIEEGIKQLRRACRTRDPVKIDAAIGHVAKLFLRARDGR